MARKHAQNSVRNTTGLRPPFPKGTSGNPGGRPKGLVALIEGKLTKSSEIVDFYLDKLRFGRGRESMEAAAWLGDRLYGKPIQGIEHAGVGGEPIHVTVTWGDDET